MALRGWAEQAAHDWEAKHYHPPVMPAGRIQKEQDLNETCDRCGPNVAAKARVILQSGRSLYFCNHCHRKHADALNEAGATLPLRYLVDSPSN